MTATEKIRLIEAGLFLAAAALLVFTVAYFRATKPVPGALEPLDELTRRRGRKRARSLQSSGLIDEEFWGIDSPEAAGLFPPAADASGELALMDDATTIGADARDDLVAGDDIGDAFANSVFVSPAVDASSPPPPPQGAGASRTRLDADEIDAEEARLVDEDDPELHDLKATAASALARLAAFDREHFGARTADAADEASDASPPVDAVDPMLTGTNGSNGRNGNERARTGLPLPPPTGDGAALPPPQLGDPIVLDGDDRRDVDAEPDQSPLR